MTGTNPPTIVSRKKVIPALRTRLTFRAILDRMPSRRHDAWRRPGGPGTRRRRSGVAPRANAGQPARRCCRRRRRTRACGVERREAQPLALEGRTPPSMACVRAPDSGPPKGRPLIAPGASRRSISLAGKGTGTGGAHAEVQGGAALARVEGACSWPSFEAVLRTAPQDEVGRWGAPRTELSTVFRRVT